MSVFGFASRSCIRPRWPFYPMFELRGSTRADGAGLSTQRIARIETASYDALLKGPSQDRCSNWHDSLTATTRCSLVRNVTASMVNITDGPSPNRSRVHRIPIANILLPRIRAIRDLHHGCRGRIRDRSTTRRRSLPTDGIYGSPFGRLLVAVSRRLSRSSQGPQRSRNPNHNRLSVSNPPATQPRRIRWATSLLLALPMPMTIGMQLFYLYYFSTN
jgi:hypothetical protein